MDIEEKLRTYSLDLTHKDGGPKANGFIVMLGIDLAAIGYLSQEIRAGIKRNRISLVEARTAEEVFCLVHFRIAGPGRYSHRVAQIRTGWIYDRPAARPRLVTAYLRPKERR